MSFIQNARGIIRSMILMTSRSSSLDTSIGKPSTNLMFLFSTKETFWRVVILFQDKSKYVKLVRHDKSGISRLRFPDKAPSSQSSCLILSSTDDPSAYSSWLISFNLNLLYAKSKTSHVLLSWDILFADDAALANHTLDGIQDLTNYFSKACDDFGLTISIKNRGHGGRQSQFHLPPQLMHATY